MQATDIIHNEIPRVNKNFQDFLWVEVFRSWAAELLSIIGLGQPPKPL
jgi:hypothetical protein